MHGETTDKFAFRKGTNLFPAAFPVVFHRKAYAALRDTRDPVIADGDLMGVPAQVFSDLLRSPKRPFGVDYPWFDG